MSPARKIFSSFTSLIWAAAAGSAFFALSPSDAQACSADTDCLVGERTYRIRMPEGHDGKTKVGAIFFMHGWRGSAAAVMRNKVLGKTVSDMGLALIAPKSRHEDWALPGSPSGEKPVEIEFFDALTKDVEARFPIDTSRMMASGFSAGGMMVWNLVCDRPDMFAGYAPISGTFWEPMPKTCKGNNVNLVHTHGKKDTMVPLTGRVIADTKQGNVFTALEMYASKGRYDNERQFSDGDLECTEQHDAKGKLLEFCLHPRGHDMRVSYVVRAWKRFEEKGAFATTLNSEGG